MSQIKVALVNARLLGFLYLDLRRDKMHRTVQTDCRGQIKEMKGIREVHLATSMRAASAQVAAAQDYNQERYALHRNSIRKQIDSGKRYPWEELLRLRPVKFYSDLVESILGAIFVDAGRSLLPCVAFIERLGLQEHMDRLIQEEVDVRHPRERLQCLARERKPTYDVSQNVVDRRYHCKRFLRLIETRFGFRFVYGTTTCK